MRLIYLSPKFYQQYAACREIMKKPSRPYACLFVEVEALTFAIPFRYHIPHKYAFFTYNDCGLDYTKAVLVPDESYIGVGRPQVEQREFNALKGQDARILREFSRYLKLYRKAALNRTNPHYSGIIQYSALQYFEEYIL